MGKHKHFKVEAFLNFLYEAEIHAFPKTWKKWIPQYRKSMEKHKHFKFMTFLNISGAAEIHTTPRENRIFITRKKYGKKNIRKLWVSQIFQVKQKSIRFQKHGKRGFPQYGKSMGKYKHSTFIGSLNLSGEAEIHTIPRIWRK